MKTFVSDSIFKKISEVAQELQLPTYVVGGFVRDKILQRPGASKDIDLVCVGSGIVLAKAVAKKLNVKKVNTFKNFGTAQFRYGNIELEFVGARKESYDRNSRKPVVEDGTLEEDLERRDFTINAMAISLNKADFGTLIDPFKGQQHLQEKLLKTPLAPVQTYSDDPLRMMRAIRFACQLQFTIESESFDAIKNTQERIEIISVERVADELHKIMQSPKPSIGLLLFYQSGLMAHFIPEIVALKGVEEVDGQLHKDNFYHTLQVVDNLAETSEKMWLRYAALFHDIGKPITKKFIKPTGWTFHNHEFVGAKMVYKIFKRLKLPLGPKLKYTQKIVRLSSRPIAVTESQATDSAARRLLFDAGDDLNDLMLLCEADITTLNQKKKQCFLANFKKVRAKLQEVEESDKVRNFQPPVTGEEIMETFGLPPCREIGTIKETIKEAILQGTIKNERGEAWELMLSEAQKLGLTPKK